MPRNEIKGNITRIRTRAPGAKRAQATALMSAKEIRARIAKGFPALPLALQDAYVHLIEASLAKLQRPPKGNGKSRNQ